MNVFEAFKRIRNVEFAGTMMYEMVQTYKTQEEICKHLQSEIPEEQLLEMVQAAKEKDNDYPLSFDGLQ
nr:MAG TPA: hypothetical protein [Caudoviricetes sp.]